MNTGDDGSSLGHVVWTTNLHEGEGGRWTVKVRLVRGGGEGWR